MTEFKKSLNGFSYTYEKELAANETVIIKMPPISPNKRGVNDIGWQTEGDQVELFGTLSADPESANAIWQKIIERDEINKTVSGLKVVNSGLTAGKVIIRVILN